MGLGHFAGRLNSRCFRTRNTGARRLNLYCEPVRSGVVLTRGFRGGKYMIARWMIVGFVLWFVITLAFRFVGQDIFTTGPTGGISWLFMTLPFVMFALTFLLLKLFRVNPSDRAEAASIFAVPGLLIGIYEINSFQFVFPELAEAGLAQPFAALMFACYAAVIISGIVSSRLQSI